MCARDERKKNENGKLFKRKSKIARHIYQLWMASYLYYTQHCKHYYIDIILPCHAMRSESISLVFFRSFVLSICRFNDKTTMIETKQNQLYAKNSSTLLASATVFCSIENLISSIQSTLQFQRQIIYALDYLFFLRCVNVRCRQVKSKISELASFEKTHTRKYPMHVLHLFCCVFFSVSSLLYLFSSEMKMRYANDNGECAKKLQNK